VQLEEPEYDAKIWARLKTSDAPVQATAYPVVKVYTGANTAFIKQAPQLTAFFSKYRTSAKIVSEALLDLQQNPSSGETRAVHQFLRTHSELWSAWMPSDVAGRIRAALK
jgi:glycine betaine/proline transport system substrate-binding protein